MNTTDEWKTPQGVAPGGPPPGGEDQERSTSRLLKILFTVLALAAVGLLVLLVWLLKPVHAGPPPGQAAGYPIEVVTTIYGTGDGSADASMSTPLGVAFDDQGNVWVSNTGRSRVEEYTSGGDYIRTIGTSDAGKLYAPYGITVDNDRGIVYVADMGGRTVQMYKTDGNYIGPLPAPGQKEGTFGANGLTPYCVQLSNGRIVVSSSDGLYFFDQDGKVVAYWGARSGDQHLSGPGDGMFNFPDSFTVDPATGWVYVADTGNRRVIALDQDGIERWVSGTPDAKGKITSFWQLPRGITLGPDGRLYVVDTFRFDQKGMGGGHIVVLSKDGALLSEFGRSGTEDGAFSYPDQIASGPDGLWAIADRENARVVVFRLHAPFPETTDLLAHRYPDGFSEPGFVWVTPPPTPPHQDGG